MALVWIVIGGLIGAAIGDESDGFFGMLAGAGIAWLLHANHQLRGRLASLADSIGSLEAVVRALQLERRAERRAAATPADAPEPAESAVPEPPKPAAAPPLDDPDRYGTRPAVTATSDAGPAESVTRAASMRAPTAEQHESRDAGYNDPLDRLAESAKRWMTTGNVPVKLGVIVSFFGVGFLLKYAVDNSVI